MNQPHVVAVCVSTGGIPKNRVAATELQPAGLLGDGHSHEKHIRPHRALLIQDGEIIDELNCEGFALRPGSLGENLTVRNLNVQKMLPGTRLRLAGGPLIELTEPRKPCYVLDQVDPALQAAVVGRCGMLARVVETGRVLEGQVIEIAGSAAATT